MITNVPVPPLVTALTNNIQHLATLPLIQLSSDVVNCWLISNNETSQESKITIADVEIALSINNPTLIAVQQVKQHLPTIPFEFIQHCSSVILQYTSNNGSQELEFKITIADVDYYGLILVLQPWKKWISLYMNYYKFYNNGQSLYNYWFDNGWVIILTYLLTYLEGWLIRVRSRINDYNVTTHLLNVVLLMIPVLWNNNNNIYKIKFILFHL